MHMQPRLLIKAGSSKSSLTQVPVNAEPVAIDNEHFQGSVSVRIQDFLGPKGKHEGPDGPPPGAFSEPNDTFSILLYGRFKDAVNAKDVLWGNAWEKPIRDHLPYGTSAALKFVHYVDPALQQDVYADKPWALSPMLSTMNRINVRKIDAKSDLPAVDNKAVPEDLGGLFDSENNSTSGVKAEVEALQHDAMARRKFFAKADKLQAVKLSPDQVFAMDFCNGYIDFKTLSLKLPVGLSFSLERLWDGQPVTFVLRDKEGTKEYLFVTFEIVRHDGEAPADIDDKSAAVQKHDDVEDVAGREDVDQLGVD